MAQLHQQHFETSQNQTKALENITSTSSFTSTTGCTPIYNGKDKDACTEWLQRCKEASYYTGYNFRSALLQRSSQDVAKVIQSLDEELPHDKLIEEIMCAFSGIPSTAAAIDELSHISQQPGQNLLIYINKYRDLHWWCTKKLPQEETYKFTLSQFCSSLQDPIGRKLFCEKLWDDKEGCQIYRNALMKLPEPTNSTELQNTEESLKFSKHQWKSMRQPTTKNPTMVDNTTTITITTTITTTVTTTAKTTPRALKTTATKENQPMAPRYSSSSVLDQGKSSKSLSF